MAESGTKSEEEVDKMMRIEFEKFKFRSGVSFKDFTLFLPTVSVGNIGQLSIDFLLSNIGEKSRRPVKLGRIFHPSLECVVALSLDDLDEDDDECAMGSEDLKEFKDLMTCCEILYVKSLKYIIIQFHAPITMRGRQDFVDAFMRWVEKQGFGEIIMLGSMFAADRVDYQLDEQNPVRFLASDSIGESKTEDLVKTLTGNGYKPLELRQFPAKAVMEPKDRIPSANGQLHMPGSGITKLVYEKCQMKSLPFLALLVFASEGINIPEATLIFGAVNLLYKIKNVGDNNEGLKIPPTWFHFKGSEPNYSQMY